jgi:hypothetical protein
MDGLQFRATPQRDRMRRLALMALYDDTSDHADLYPISAGNFLCKTALSLKTKGPSNCRLSQHEVPTYDPHQLPTGAG